jgi:hypothetical protein
MAWPELDKIELTAGWIAGTERFAVQREHKGIRRGRWEFEHIGKNEWQCTRGGSHYLREQGPTRELNPRDTDESRIPNDIQLKAKEFLSEEVKLKPKKPTTSTMGQR